MGGRRRRLLAGARGAVLEIGGGTGANLAHYRDVDRVTIAEPNPFMRRRLDQKLTDARVPVEVSPAGTEELPFPDGSFDTVVSTLVLCTVPDQESALDEVRRVLRPGGRLLFIEHVRAGGPQPAGRIAWGLSGDVSSGAAISIETPSRPSRRPGSR
jgi:ubiquinone/menaquinone biosynthesis C-methylase UbiE